MSLSLSAFRGASLQASSASRSVAPASRKLVLVRAKELREFREDTGEIVQADGQKKPSAIYADQVRAQARPKDNMSKEMKDRLRKEYIGFGGSDSQAMGNNYFLWIAVVVSILAVMSKMIGAI